MAGIKASENCTECHECIACMRHGKKLKLCDDCYRTEVITRLKVRKVKRTLKDATHKPVQYTQGEGWRIGYLLELGPTAASVQPIGTIGGALPSPIRVPIADVMAERYSSSKMPTVEDYYAMAEQNRKKVVLIADRAVPALAHSAFLNSPVVSITSPIVSITPPPETGVEAPWEPTPCEKKMAQKAGKKKLAADPVQAMERNVGIDLPKKKKVEPPHPPCPLPPPMPEPAKPRLKHAPVDLTEARRLYETGMSVNDVVEAVRGTRAAFDVKKLIRKEFKAANILRD